MPRGFSPRVPEGWAPAGLKYRRQAAFQSGFAVQWSRMMSSIVTFVRPYGLVGPSGQISGKS